MVAERRTKIVSAYYNENDPFAAAWLRELIKANLIAPGEVDERSIEDVEPNDLRGFKQCHFFAGIGGWSYALRLAGWPDDEPVWTGSCPCQPFSVAGDQAKQSDERHLWPYWFGLIRERRPPAIFGEQVKNAVPAGWLDDVFADLEAEAYSCGAAVLPGCAVGTPHERDRLWFVATHNRRKRVQRQQQSSLSREFAFSWCKDVRRVEDLRGRSDIPEPLVRSLNDGVSGGVEQLRGYGNAIVPQVAQAFIEAYMSASYFPEQEI